MAKKWIQAATKKMEQKGTKGSFSRTAKKAGMGTGAYASHVLASDTASPKMKKKAQFAKNVMGGSTPLSKNSLKGSELTNDRSANLAHKNSFVAEKGGQRADNLHLKENPDTPIIPADK